jgi:hypothetical protein
MRNSDDDRRQYSRVDFQARVAVSQGDVSFITDLVDVSLNGLLIKTPNEYHLRSDLPCTAKIILSDEAQISMQAALVHSGNHSLGFHCTSIDMDSITHLRRLIEINLEDPNASERVLAELVIKAEQPQ